MTKLRNCEITRLRNGAWVLSVAVALAGCRVGETPPAAGATPTRMAHTEPTVRIGLKVDTSAVFISTSAPAAIVDRDGNTIAQTNANERWTFSSDSAGSVIAMEAASGQSTATTAGPITVRVPDDATVTIGGKPYRGDVLIRTAGPGRISAINVLEMEQYLQGVVGFEIGHLPAAQIEATKAQAIAARTYAIGNMNSRNALGFDFYPTVADQVYGGLSGEDSIIVRAVRETRGEILTNNGVPIIAYYSSTCGGHTADIDESWPWRPPQPYLKGHPDTDNNGEAYCKTSGRFRWNVSWAGDSLRTILQQTLGQRLGNTSFHITKLEDVQLDGHSESGRARAVLITADGTTYRVPADSIRWVLRPTANGSLNSSLIFNLNTTRDAGAVTRVDVQGGGWGHGIGMCQVGAMGRARAGQSYREILAAYYTDTKVEKLY